MTSFPDDALDWRSAPVDRLTIEAGARTDLFSDPRGAIPVLNAPRRLGAVSGDFLLSARVLVDFVSTFDAGVLLVYANSTTWAKLCFEYSPSAQPMIVSVVTREISDDCNSFIVDDRRVWLRIQRLGAAFAFHASTDGQRWHLIRHFALPVGPDVHIGFLGQSPTGAGCTVTFDAIHFSTEPIHELRSGH